MPTPKKVAGPTNPRAANPGFVEKYGYKVPSGTPLIALELQAYREGITPAMGGLGPEQHFKNAFRIAWPNYEWSDWVEMLVHAWCNFKYTFVIGHRRASKTYTSAHIALLDYSADPYRTLTSLTTVTFEGLKLRMWSDLLRAYETAAVKGPFQIRSSTNEMRIYPNDASKESGEKYQIHGMAVNHTKDAAGRIKGGHAPRRRLFLDEAEDIDAVIYDAMGNPMSAPDARCVALANPIEKISRFGDLCKPKGGWGSVTDTDLFWETDNGICLHFDGLQSPNLTQTKRIFTGILSREDVEAVRVKPGEDSVEWWSQIRGWFPPDGMVSKIFPSSVITRATSSIVFDFQTEKCATLDPAFESDDCVLHLGDKGKLRDDRMAISGTKSITLKFDVSPGAEPKDHQIAHQVMDICGKAGVQPKNFIMDKSGGGRGVYAILQKEWSMEIHGIDYGGASTDRPLRSDDTDKCSDIYEKFVTELWFRGSAACEDGILAGLGNLNPLTVEDLNSRRYSTKKATQGTVQVAETKPEMKKRLGRSPDNGDAAVQFAELLIREGHGPGRAKKKPGTKTRWRAQRQRAVTAGKRYAETSEFAHQ